MSKWFKSELGKVMTGCPHRWYFNEYLDFSLCIFIFQETTYCHQNHEKSELILRMWNKNYGVVKIWFVKIFKWQNLNTIGFWES